MATTYEDIDVNQGADIAIELDCVDEAGAVKDLTNHSINVHIKVLTLKIYKRLML